MKEFNFKKVFIQMIGIVMARAVFSGMNPIAIGYFAAVYIERSGRFGAMLAIAIGMVTILPLTSVAKYLIIMIVFSIIISLIEYNGRYVTTVVMGSLAGALTAALTIANGLLNSNMEHHILLGIVEGIAVFALTFIFRKGIEPFVQGTKGQALDNEQIVSIAIILAVFLYGLPSFEVKGFSLILTVALFSILLTGYKYGAGYGALAGAASGVILAINSGQTCALPIFLYTARCEEFMTAKGQDKGAEICRKHNIDGLVVIGGDGSFRGAGKLAERGINTVGLPGTIDLDIACTDYTIGFDTAVNTAMEAIDKVRDTSTSHERCSIIEVMGRKAGYIALWCGIANGAEDILITERYDNDEQRIINSIIEKRKVGKKHHIIVNAEGVGDSYGMAKRIEAATGIETRATIIGHIQRGGSPTCKDRVYASAMGAHAVDILCNGASNRIVGYRDGKFVDYDVQEALSMTKDIDQYLYDMSKKLSR
jgi:6-phosphofructokinase 1